MQLSRLIATGTRGTTDACFGKRLRAADWALTPLTTPMILPFPLAVDVVFVNCDASKYMIEFSLRGLDQIGRLLRNAIHRCAQMRAQLRRED